MKLNWLMNNNTSKYVARQDDTRYSHSSLLHSSSHFPFKAFQLNFNFSLYKRSESIPMGVRDGGILVTKHISPFQFPPLFLIDVKYCLIKREDEIKTTSPGVLNNKSWSREV